MASKDEMELDTEEVEEKIERTFPNMDLAQSVWKLECEGVDIEVWQLRVWEHQTNPSLASLLPCIRQ